MGRLARERVLRGRAFRSFGVMALAKQSDRQRRKHGAAMKAGEACHKGVAYRLPAGLRGVDD
jgi:nitrate/TMAO reductase-like tetraheme cytochrome c subunit